MEIQPQQGRVITASEFRAMSSQQVEAFLQDDYGWHTRVPVSRGPFSYSIRAWSGDKVAVGTVETGADEVIRACVRPSMVLIHLPQNHGLQYRVGRQLVTAMADCAVMLPPDHDYTLRSIAGRKFWLAIDAGQLTTELEDHSPRRRGHTLIKPLAVRLAIPERRRLLTLHRRFQQLADAQPGRDDDLAPRALEFRLVAWCANKILENGGRQALSHRNQLRVDQLAGWIEEHLAEPISVECLAELSGLGCGGLNKIFKAARGMAPMEFVQSRRLAAAQKMLRNATGSTLVTWVALDCGFTHLGRFARSYRQAFGETPSDTLESARRRLRSEPS